MYFNNLKKKQLDQCGKNCCYTDSFMSLKISNLRTIAFCFENILSFQNKFWIKLCLYCDSKKKNNNQTNNNNKKAKKKVIKHIKPFQIQQSYLSIIMFFPKKNYI